MSPLQVKGAFDGCTVPSAFMLITFVLGAVWIECPNGTNAKLKMAKNTTAQTVLFMSITGLTVSAVSYYSPQGTGCSPKRTLFKPAEKMRSLSAVAFCGCILIF
jgi:hypothetical protein